MHISMLVGKSIMKILLKDVLYAPKMGLTLVSIEKIDAASYAALFLLRLRTMCLSQACTCVRY
jgi:hypothetical protein